MDRQHLAQAVWSNPADWAARLIYADAMEEAGEDADIERDVAHAVRDWVTARYLGGFTRGYVDCALWAGVEGGIEGTTYRRGDIHDDSMARMIEDCVHFQTQCAGLIGDDWARAGRDFFLTRNRHGAGFWDGGWEHARELTEAAHNYGEAQLSIGTDNMVHLLPF